MQDNGSPKFHIKKKNAMFVKFYRAISRFEKVKKKNKFQIQYVNEISTMKQSIIILNSNPIFLKLPNYEG